MNKLLIFSILLVIGCVRTQDTDIIPDNSEVLEFIVHVERIPEVLGLPNRFICVGTLLTLTHILTPESVYRDPIINVTIPSQLNIRFHSNRIGTGFRASPVQIIRHNTANLAILRMGQRVDQQLRFSPRRRDNLLLNRFCTFYGFDMSQVTPSAQQLVASPAMVRDVAVCGVGVPFCAEGRSGQFPTCGGFIGAPATCDGITVSAMVIVDEFCNATNPRVTLFRLQDQLQWINDNTSGAKYFAQSALSIIFGIILVKLLG